MCFHVGFCFCLLAEALCAKVFCERNLALRSKCLLMTASSRKVPSWRTYRMAALRPQRPFLPFLPFLTFLTFSYLFLLSFLEVSGCVCAFVSACLCCLVVLKSRGETSKCMSPGMSLSCRISAASQPKASARPSKRQTILEDLACKPIARRRHLNAEVSKHMVSNGFFALPWPRSSKKEIAPQGAHYGHTDTA